MLGYGQVSDLDFQTDQPNLASLSQELNETRAILAEAQQALRALGYDKNYTDEARTTASQLVTSEAFALTILESSPDCLKVLTADGLIEYINQNGACLLEVNDYRTILGQHWKTFWPENVRPIIIQSIEAALSGQSINFTALAPTVRGTEKHWDISLAAIPSEAGHPVKLLVVSRDVTDKVQSEIALAESEARFRGTFENAAVGVAHIALGGTWLAVNDKVCSIFGYSRQELLAKTLPHITHDEDLAADIHQRDRILSGEIDAYSMDKRYYHKDGSVVWGSLTVSLQRHVDGRPDYFISIIEDISARIAVEATLRETQAKYQAALRLGRIGAWETDYINGTRHWSQEAMSLFGISLVGGIGHVGPSDELYSALHPDDAGLPDLITRSLRT